MKNLLNLSLAILLTSSLSGCIIVDRDYDRDSENWRSQQKENREIISDLALQTERSKVLAKLGAPHFSEAFTKEGVEYRVLYYRTQHRHSDGDTTKDETTPLVFKDNKLIGWGQEILASVL
ncbi:DUF3192 domain-containing protein [Aliikangiella coralliicola]|uniref:DUF3192 domain-containing protein n=1 Tax=Aliikangiella coralliicola TaxID=2592383 RepID=A0A545UIP7_9GAMM|nr:DUF3192 domain-containing protein [Aliikangiella coralliicola]TQV89339.1 DUF3192 domain-containing protein [Aliikangiella coralliicola]